MTSSRRKEILVLGLLSRCVFGYADSFLADNPPSEAIIETKKEKEPIPWLTGPLLTPAAYVVPNGHYNIEPYLFITTNYGIYDAEWHAKTIAKDYNIITQIPVQFGMPWDCDFTIVPAWSWNHTDGASHWVLNDLQFYLDYQLLYDQKGKWWPAIKLELGASVPLGRYRKLNPRAKATDIGGVGSWLPGAAITMSRLFWWGGHFFFIPRLNIQYTIPNSVHVSDISIYGGGKHTRGKVYPGQILHVLFGFEISLSQRWAIANDFSYMHINKSRFKGHAGTTAGMPNRVGLPSSEQLSLAPAIEYNWSENYGVIAGAWFSVAGRNIPEFASAVIALNIYH